MSDVEYPEGPDQAIEDTAAEMPQVAGAAQAPAEEAIQDRRGHGRPVTLVRQSGGGYEIWRGNRCVQSFCAEWEDVTNFQLPDGIEQRVRILVHPMGDAGMIAPQRNRSGADAPEPVGNVVGRVEERVMTMTRAPDEPTVVLTASPAIGRSPADLIAMFRELPRHQQEIIERQIVENYGDAQDALSSNVQRDREQLSVVGQLREALRNVMDVVDRL